jgi:hypothetical protein
MRDSTHNLQSVKHFLTQQLLVARAFAASCNKAASIFGGYASSQMVINKICP